MKIRGINYHVEVIGEGKPLFLLHGFTGASENWSSLLEQVQGYQFILVDIIGHGKTEKPSEASRYSTEEAVEDLHEILRQLELEKTSILGYSMGGRLALSFAVSYPEKVDKLLLESSSPGLVYKEERRLRRESDRKLAEKILTNGIAAFVKKWEDIPLFASQKKLAEEKRRSIYQQRLQNSEIGLANSLIGMGTGSQPSWWDKLGELREIPVLLICGEEDLKYRNIAKRMNKKLLNAKIVVVEKAGHTIHVEEPRIFGKIVNEFLNE